MSAGRDAKTGLVEEHTVKIGRLFDIGYRHDYAEEANRGRHDPDCNRPTLLEQHSAVRGQRRCEKKQTCIAVQDHHSSASPDAELPIHLVANTGT
jgi:hypothetical protein